MLIVTKPLKKFKKEQGIGLVEVIFSLGVAVVVITSLVSLALFTLRASTQSKMLLTGTKLVSQEIENVRAARDITATTSSESWGDFVDLIRDCNPAQSKCHMNLSPGFVTVTKVSYGSTMPRISGIEVYFLVSTVTGASLGSSEYPDVIKISVFANWDIGGVTKRAANYTILSSWRDK